MLPVAELPFFAEREILGEIELQIWAGQDRQEVQITNAPPVRS